MPAFFAAHESLASSRRQLVGGLVGGFALFDGILGFTPADPDEPIQGGIGPQEGAGWGGPDGRGGPPELEEEARPPLPEVSPAERERILEQLRARRRLQLEGAGQ